MGGIGGIGITAAKMLLQNDVNLSLTTLSGNPSVEDSKKLLENVTREGASLAKFQIIEADITIEKDLKKQIENSKKTFK